MFSKLKNLLNNNRNNDNSDSVQNRNIILSICVLLIEAARADGEFEISEEDTILDILINRFGLSPQDADSLIDEAIDARDESLDLYRFTRDLNEELSIESRNLIIEEIWRVVYADGKLDGHEDYIIHHMAGLLNVHRDELIAAKLKVRDEMEK